MTSIINNPNLAGCPAKKQEFFGQYDRYAVAPVHTRFDAVQWFVWDALHPNSDENRPEVIRQAATREEALAGLEV